MLCLVIVIAPPGCVFLGALLYALMNERRDYTYAREEFESIRQMPS